MARRIIKNQFVSKANIILFGTGNSGKTTTLRILYYLLTGTTAPANKTRVQITYKGSKIDFAFNGYTLDVVEGNVAFFEDNPCDIAVSPTRTDGGPVIAMNYFIDKTFPMTENIIWKKVADIPVAKRASKGHLVAPKNYAKNYPQSSFLASKLKDIIEGCIDN